MPQLSHLVLSTVLSFADFLRGRAGERAHSGDELGALAKVHALDRGAHPILVEHALLSREELLALDREPDEDPAPVALVAHALEEAAALETRHDVAHDRLRAPHVPRGLGDRERT